MFSCANHGHCDEGGNLNTAIHHHFQSERTYLDSATMGLCPATAASEMKASIDAIVAGTCNAIAFDDNIERSRVAFSSITGSPKDWVSIVPMVSIATAVLSSHLTPGQRVLIAEEDFTSVLFPLLQAQQRGVDVRVVPLEQLLDAIDSSIDWVAVSAVQSKDGRVLDLDALASTCNQHGVKSYVDLTQAAGWLEINVKRFDITACGGYKWLLCPRGAGFMTVKPELWEDIPPVAPGWYAGELPWESIYGGPLRLASNARRYDISPAWLCWVGAAEALELIAAVGVTSIEQHNTTLAAHFCDGLGLPNPGSAIASVQLSEQQVQAAKRAGVVFSERGGSSRFSFHLYNKIDEVDLCLEALTNR